VTTALRVEFFDDERAQIESVPTQSREAYELYLAAIARAQQGQLQEENIEAALEAIDAALRIDDEFALAWAEKSTLHGSRQLGLASDLLDEHRDAQLSSALRAVTLDPGLPNAQLALASARSNRGDWVEAEIAYRQASAGDSARPFALNTGGAGFTFAVGNFERGLEIAERANRSDPLNVVARCFYILGLGLTGDLDDARQDYERGKAVFGDEWLGGWCLSMARLGAGPTPPDEIPMAFAPTTPHAIGRERMESPEEGLAILRERYAAGENWPATTLIQFAIWAAYLGDAELAFETEARAVEQNAQQALIFWLPSMREVRQLPKFKALVRDLGLVDYWNMFGWPELCRPLGDGDFECS
jgi:tetratricopeptide (TPR) repeat protein